MYMLSEIEIARVKIAKLKIGPEDNIRMIFECAIFCAPLGSGAVYLWEEMWMSRLSIHFWTKPASRNGQALLSLILRISNLSPR